MMTYGPLLWVLTLLLFGRVTGQLVVFFYAPKFLPPMEQWQSGLVPYPFLVSVQAVVLALMAWISLDFPAVPGFGSSRGRGWRWWSYGGATFTSAPWSSGMSCA